MSATALIADDEPHLAAHLAQHLAALWPELAIVASVGNGLEALERIQALRPDIAFLDIRMPGLSGLEVAGRLTVPCRLVFVTAYDQFAVEAFEREAVDYLLKPVNDQRLGRTIARLRSGLPAAPPPEALLAQLRALLGNAPVPGPLRWIKAQAGQAIRLVGVDEVCYFQASDKYTTVRTRDAELLIRTPIKELAEQLDPGQFWQISRGILVNARQIAAARHDAMGRLTLQLKTRPETLPVSRGYAHLFRQM
ncbi:MAG: LytTR family DNA-binding domain-containing protein [Holophaga sp.]|nr:LytTR family DNA-binding domain-containing protein [Holophaga sp.]